MDESSIKNMIRTGTVSSYDRNRGVARVKFTEFGDFVSAELKVFASAGELKVNQFVVCLFPVNGGGEGFVMGGVQGGS